MTFFDILRDILFTRKDKVQDLDTEKSNVFVPFLFNRWLSFYDKDQAVFVNEILNRYTGVFEDKSQSYNFYYNITSKLRFKKIQYVKKVKKEKEENNNIALIAKNKQISKREIELYIDFLK